MNYILVSNCAYRKTYGKQRCRGDVQACLLSVEAL